MTAHRGSAMAALSARLLVIAVVVLAVLARAVPALAAEAPHQRVGLDALWAGCPFKDPQLNLCLAIVTKSGELRIGKLVVPISRTFVSMEGGFTEGSLSREPPENERITYLPVENGEAIQPMPIPVPGGLAGVLEASSLPSSLRTDFESLVNSGLGSLTATIELAGPASSVGVSFYNAFYSEGTTLEEPLRIKLTNQLLGENCHIGSASEPIHVQATESTTSPPLPNRPIEGNFGALELYEGGQAIHVYGNSVVDNAVAIPAASGCGGSLAPLFDRAIDAKVGLPSPPGHSTVILNNTLELIKHSLVEG
jgi:hypothetical protein